HQAYVIIEPTGDRYAISVALGALSLAYLEIGASQQAIHYSDLALDGFRGLGDPHAEAWPWQARGRAHHQLGEHAEAITCFEQAITLYGADSTRAYALDWMGDTQKAMGDLGAARGCWQLALAVLQDSAVTVSASIERKLDDLL